jgi:hypothetical protein
MPMNISSTQLLWIYQDFNTKQTDSFFITDDLLEPQEELQALFAEFEKRMPDISDEMLSRILEKI